MTGTVYVPTHHPEHFSIQYYDNGDPARSEALQAGWTFFNHQDPSTGLTFDILTRPSNYTVELAVSYCLPQDTPSGRYRIETFIPGLHATTRRAVFTVGRYIQPGEDGRGYLQEALVLVDMYDENDIWYSLGDFDLDTSLDPRIGRVRQFDITREEPPTEVSFGPMRWIPLVAPPEDGRRFDSPVGTPEERAGPFPTGRYLFRKYPTWAGDWFDVNPFLNFYIYGCHTGADLNLPGVSAADKGKPVYAIGDGLVTYAGRAGTWGNIIVIEHPDALVTLPDGQSRHQPVYSRYGHVDEHIQVRAGEAVARGQLIGYIGLAAGATAGWHLHFDISYTDILKYRPAHWPDQRNSNEKQKAEVLRYYVDPFVFLRDNHGIADG